MANLNLTQEKIEALRSEYKYRNVRGKYPRQKMLKEYTSIYPWVLPDEVDPHFAFCTICECRLCAKRSDLGKHEGSIKHKENAAKKALEGSTGVLKGQELQQNKMKRAASTSASVSQDEDEEGEGYEAESVQAVGNDDDGLYIKQEPVIDLVENSNAEFNLGQLSSNSDEEGEEEDEEDDDDEDYEPDDCAYVPPAKRRVSDALNVPAQITVSDVTTLQRFSIREIPSTSVTTYSKPTVTQSGNLPQLHYTPPAPLASIAPTQSPLPARMITIKKVTAPLPSTVTAAAQASSTAAALTSLPAIPASITISQQPKPAATSAPVAAATATPQQASLAGTQPPTAQATHSNTTATAMVVQPVAAQLPPIRDSMVLFFDSICASVKALPPKLATEAKIRVMELVGELEIRAIAEREQSSAAKANSATGQQSAMVASTTK